MSKFKKADLKFVRTIPLKKRIRKVKVKDFAKVFSPVRSFSEFIKSFPNILAARDLQLFVDDIIKAHAKEKPIILMMGAHIIKVGLSPLIIDLIKRNIITCVVMNGAAAIHDTEIAMWGMTSENVEENIKDGSFGMSKESGEFINNVLLEFCKRTDVGFGEAMGETLRNAPRSKLSLLASCYSNNVPATVHVAIGTDIIHQHPSMNGAITGEMTFRDFKILCEVVKKLKGGGVVINVGSAVVLPEVFLKALTVARNLGAKASGFSTANFDMIQHYRPKMNVVLRPTQNGGTGYFFTGHHEIMIPLLCAMIKNRLKVN